MTFLTASRVPISIALGVKVAAAGALADAAGTATGASPSTLIILSLITTGGGVVVAIVSKLDISNPFRRKPKEQPDETEATPMIPFAQYRSDLNRKDREHAAEMARMQTRIDELSDVIDTVRGIK